MDKLQTCCSVPAFREKVIFNGTVSGYSKMVFCAYPRGEGDDCKIY